MKMKLMICTLALGLMSQLGAYTVKNNLSRKITLSQFTYRYGSQTQTQNSTVVVNAGQSWADTGSCSASSASFTATIGTQVFIVNNLGCLSRVVFSTDASGDIRYTVS